MSDEQNSTREIIWVCPACGKWAETRDKIVDVSCYIHSIRCYKDKCTFSPNGLVTAVLEGGIVTHEDD